MDMYLRPGNSCCFGGSYQLSLKLSQAWSNADLKPLGLCLLVLMLLNFIDFVYGYRRNLILSIEE